MWRSPVRFRAGLRGGGLAQWVEHRLCKPGAAGSSPAFSTTFFEATRAAGGGPEPPRRATQRKRAARRPRAGMPRGASAREVRQGARRMPVAPGGDEGRGKPRKAPARRTRPLTWGCPNGATRRAEGPAPPRGGANPANRNIPVAGGGEDNSDSPSSGERPGRSPNRAGCGPPGVVGPAEGAPWREPKRLERRAVGGDSPVGEARGAPAGTLSRAGHEDPRPNRPGPPGKAKYSRETDSEPVP